MRMERENKDLLQTIKTFLKLEKSFDISTIHYSITRDLDLAQLHSKYMELSNSAAEIKRQSFHELLKYLLQPDRIKYFNEIYPSTHFFFVCEMKKNHFTFYSVQKKKFKNRKSPFRLL